MIFAKNIITSFFQDKFKLLSLFFAILGYFFFSNYLHLTADFFLLFLPNKLFLGSWIQEGIFPLYNPYIFAGIPFAFDIGLGNLHPLNLLFLLPFPHSYAAWMAIHIYIFLIGYYLFLKKITNTRIFAIFLTLLLFFSGSFLTRSDNGTIFGVVSHYGLLFYSLSFLKNPYSKKYWTFPLFIGFIFTLSGHIQFVLLGFIASLLIMIFIHKISLKEIISFFFILGIITSWYFLLSLPIVLESTRQAVSHEYNLDNAVQRTTQMIQIVLPFIFGHNSDGSKWNAEPIRDINTSLALTTAVIALAFFKRKVGFFLLASISFLVLATGFIPIPIFRMPAHFLVLFHVFAIIYLAQHELEIVSLMEKITSIRVLLIVAIVCLIACSFLLYSPLFNTAFVGIYQFVKNTPPNLFFDTQTISSIGTLLGKSVLLVSIFIITLLITSYIRSKTFVIAIITIFVIYEGILTNSLHLFFIPSEIISTFQELPTEIETSTYRVQSASEVIPYFGIMNYLGQVYLRPPFSKEDSFFDQTEQNTFSYLEELINYIPASWSSVHRIKSIQGYNTFVPRNLSTYFQEPSSDYRNEYESILQRNPLLGQSEHGLHINILETSFITLNDERWTDMGVRYYLSPKTFSSLQQTVGSDTRTIYERLEARPVYHSIDTSGVIEAIAPTKETPNTIEFDISLQDVNKEFIFLLNAKGFKATLNGSSVSIEQNNFENKIDLEEHGKLIIYYDPVYHLVQTVFN